MPSNQPTAEEILYGRGLPWALLAGSAVLGSHVWSFGELLTSRQLARPRAHHGFVSAEEPDDPRLACLD
jgi:hypothetical protein